MNIDVVFSVLISLLAFSRAYIDLMLVHGEKRLSTYTKISFVYRFPMRSHFVLPCNDITSSKFEGQLQ
jgi:hypothetical protein